MTPTTHKPIPFLDLRTQYTSIKKEVDAALQRVLDSGVFIGGKEVERFEEEMARFIGTRFAMSVNSGTDGLFLSLKALGIGQGDEVITTPFTFIATASVIANLGAKPVFVDINPDTFNIDADLIEAAITKRTKAIIPVHLFGQMADMDSIMRIARAHNIPVIEDAAQAIGATFNGKRAGSLGATGCFSFFPSKNLGAYGDGGIITTNNAKLVKMIRLLKNHGSLPNNKYRNVVWGTNSRLDALQAAILQVKLKYLARWNKKRQEKAAQYTRLLSPIKEVATPTINPSATSVFHEYTIRAKRRNTLKAYLEKRGVPVMVYYPIPLHLQPALSLLRYKKGDFPHAEKAAREVISLPLYPELALKDQEYIVSSIASFYTSS